jgi:hypothetical protein
MVFLLGYATIGLVVTGAGRPTRLAVGAVENDGRQMSVVSYSDL